MTRRPPRPTRPDTRCPDPTPFRSGDVLRGGDVVKTLSGGEPDTTNNRMELMAAIEALAALKRSCNVELSTDSVYVRDGITKWIFGWQKNGWKTAAKKPCAHADLWQRIVTENARTQVEWNWVKGLAGPSDTEPPDQLPRAA